jgi:hypothetical protein
MDYGSDPGQGGDSMTRLNRRRLPGRKLLRPTRAAAPQPPEPLELPAEHPHSGDSTEFAIPSVLGGRGSPPRASQQDTTVELPALQPADDPGGEPHPPAKMEFNCACGTRLVATTATYDKHTRCAMCQTVMLLNLVYDAERNSHEIVPFRVNPDKPL